MMPLPLLQVSRRVPGMVSLLNIRIQVYIKTLFLSRSPSCSDFLCENILIKTMNLALTQEPH